MYPRQIFTHKLNNRIALSFFENSKLPHILHYNSPTPLPSIPTDAYINPDIPIALNHTLKHFVHLDKEQMALAEFQKIGYLNINDKRVMAPWGRINDPEDIFGTVLLDNGRIVENTFEPMSTHRIVSRNGLFQLNDFLFTKFLDKLQ